MSPRFPLIFHSVCADLSPIYDSMSLMATVRLSESGSAEIVRRAIDVLSSGGIIVYPTETFYALGAKFDREDALERIAALKRRPHGKPFPLIIGERALLSALTPTIEPTAKALMDRFWPGPLTLLLEARNDLSAHLTGGIGTVAVRMPGPSFGLTLARQAHFPITATSANISGRAPARDVQTVFAYFGGEIDLIIDGGPTSAQLPSTIIDVTKKPFRIVREGVIGRENMAAFLMPG